MSGGPGDNERKREGVSQRDEKQPQLNTQRLWTLAAVILVTERSKQMLPIFQVDVEFINETETSLKKKETVLSVNCSPKHQSEQIL